MSVLADFFSDNHSGTADASALGMPTTFTYRDLDAWKQGMDLVEECYRFTTAFPAHELYGLTSQIRRAAVSIPSNIAEGRCRHTTKTFTNHVSIALGSFGELETCIELSARLGFLKTAGGDAAVGVSKLSRAAASVALSFAGGKAELPNL